MTPLQFMHNLQGAGFVVGLACFSDRNRRAVLVGDSACRAGGTLCKAFLRYEPEIRAILEEHLPSHNLVSVTDLWVFTRNVFLHVGLPLPPFELACALYAPREFGAPNGALSTGGRPTPTPGGQQ